MIPLKPAVPQFIADENVGKLVKSLRLLGFNTLLFSGENDNCLVKIALQEKRIILTRDTQIPKRKPAEQNIIQVILIKYEYIEEQLKQVVESLNLFNAINPFSLCLEDNAPLRTVPRDSVKERVPEYTWKTQDEYSECPLCHRVYWKGTHWAAMNSKLSRLNLKPERN